MAEMHGGGVTVSSQVGQGSRFTVSLPWQAAGELLPNAPEDTAPRQIGAPGQDDAAGLRKALKERDRHLILLAEDNEANLVTVGDYLANVGYQVAVARNGVEAVARAQEQHPDLILMDIQMPGMDGLEATRRIRADAGLAATPIVALTALAMPGDREKCIAAGANDYISKPVSLKQLAARIAAHLPQAP
jgi:CheY-like chemotaxis protein